MVLYWKNYTKLRLRQSPFSRKIIFLVKNELTKSDFGPFYNLAQSALSPSSISLCGVCFAWPLMKESKDQSSNGKCENQIKDELAGAHDKPKSQNIVRRKSNLPQVWNFFSKNSANLIFGRSERHFFKFFYWKPPIENAFTPLQESMVFYKRKKPIYP